MINETIARVSYVCFACTYAVHCLDVFVHLAGCDQRHADPITNYTYTNSYTYCAVYCVLFQAKLEASISWLCTKAFGSDVPVEFDEPLYYNSQVASAFFFKQP